MSDSSAAGVLVTVLAVLFASWSLVVIWDDLSSEPPQVDFVAPFHYDAGGDDTEDRLMLEDEYLTLQNRSEDAVDLSGWMVRSDGGRNFVIPDGIVLPSGETLTIVSGCGEDVDLLLHWCAISEIWDNESGTAYLSMPDGTRIATHHYQALCKTCHGGNNGE